MQCNKQNLKSYFFWTHRDHLENVLLQMKVLACHDFVVAPRLFGTKFTVINPALAIPNAVHTI